MPTIGARSPSSRHSLIGRLHGTGKRKQKATLPETLEHTQGWDGAVKIVNDFGDTVTSVSISSDRCLYAAGGTNKKAKVFYTSTGECAAEFDAESGVNAVVCAGERMMARVLVGTFGGWLRVYSVERRKEELAIRVGEGDAVHCMQLASKTHKLAVGGKSAFVLLYELLLPESSSAAPDGVRLNLLQRFRTVGSLTSSVSLNVDGTILAAGGEAKVVQLWSTNSCDAPTPAPPTPAKPGSPMAASPAKPPDAGGLSTLAPGSTFASDAPFASGPSDGGTPAVQFRTATPVHSLALSPSGYLAVGTTEHTEVYRVLMGPAASSSDAHNMATGRPALSGGGGTAAASALGPGSPMAGSSPMAVEPFLTLACPALHGGVSFSEMGSKLAVGGHQLVSVFDYTTGAMLVKAQQDGRVRCVALSNDGACLVVGGFDRKLRLHAVEDGTQLVAFSAVDRTAMVRSVHLSPDSTLLAMGIEAQGRGSAQLFSATSRTLLHKWAHTKPVWSVRISPDRRFLAVGGYDMKLSLYSTTS